MAIRSFVLFYSIFIFLFQSGYSIRTYADGLKGLTPVLDCVLQSGENSYTAFFSYTNESDHEIFVDRGKNNKISNKISGDELNQKQPKLFLPGSSSRWPYPTFSVNFGEEVLSWKLGDREVIVSGHSAQKCTYHIFFEKEWIDQTRNLNIEIPKNLPWNYRLYAKSKSGSAQCSYPWSSANFKCDYRDHDGNITSGLLLDALDSYQVKEVNVPLDWSHAVGVGTFLVSHESYCIFGGDAMQNYCNHIVRNYQK